MNAFTRLSDKGQVVVPKSTRDRLGWAPGLDLEVIETHDGVTLRPRRTGKTLTSAQAVAEFQRIYRHQGPPVTLEQMDEAIAEEADRRATRR
jgi:AbrB family looped-hinge helix DNA binding protein